jgi:DNA primase catalytic core
MGYIKSEYIDKLLDRASIVEVVKHYLADLKNAGANFKAKSPWSDDRTASLMVSPAKNIWKDFSTGKGGNMISFVMEKEMCSYPEAIEKIAGIYNDVVEYEQTEFSEKKKETLEKKEVLRKVLKLSHELYYKAYAQLPEEHPAKNEVELRRLYNDETIAEWGIGFAPQNFLHDKLKSSGYIQQGQALGLINDQWDKYSDRVVYPIHDNNGLIIGLAGRDISGKVKAAKWINPPVNAENLLYNKSKVWYGIHKAKFAMRKKGEAFIVEGYNDVIGFHNYGLDNTVAPCGTAITPEQINEIKKLCQRVVFCMDPDNAGKAAVLKQIPEFIKAGFTTHVVILDLDPDDFTRKYHDIIAMSGGLDNLFNASGVRIDGFRLLIDEHIKKEYIDLENQLNAAIANKKLLTEQFNNGKATINDTKIAIEASLLVETNKLKEIEISQSKKSQDYAVQQLVVSSIKLKLDTTKQELKNYASPELEKQIKDLATIEREYNEAYKSAEITRSAGAKHLCKLILTIEDSSLFEIYLGWVQNESKISKSIINSWLKELRSEIEPDEDDDIYTEYELPKEVAKKHKFSELERSIKVYGMFMALNQIYMAIDSKDDRVVRFSSVSNFVIEILQHMKDEKFPTLLVRILNVHNKEIIFDTLHKNINSPQDFYNTMTAHGNFNFKGNNNDLGTLRTYLLENMGNGRKIEVLGWQPDGNFWAWNNRIITEEGKEVSMDENGVFVHNDIHYYIPSANKIFKHSSSKYNSQKRFKVIENNISFEMYMAKVLKVHRDHAISGLLFGMASLFQDIAVEENGNFPILFLYGPGGTGKDELAYIVQSFTGLPQIPINLEGGASTLKAKIIELAQFKNGISQLSEYKRGDDKVDGTIKAIWDRVGYKRGSIESRIAIDTVDIESSVILTGNEYPNKEPIIIRTIWNEMTKNQFTKEEMEAFDELNDMTQKGISGYSHQLLQYRMIYKEHFSKKYRFWKGLLKQHFPDVAGRIHSNLSVLATTYQIFRDEANVAFPFSQNDMIDHFRKGIEYQISKINSASIMVKFWECFVTSLRGNKEDRIQVNHIVNIEGNILYFNWTHVFAKIERQWWMQYKEGSPNKNTVKDELKKAGLLVEEKTVHSFDKGREANRTSAFGINMLQLQENVRQDIIGSIMFQTSEGTLYEEDPFNKKPPEAPEQEALPFKPEDGLEF